MQSKTLDLLTKSPIQQTVTSCSKKPSEQLSIKKVWQVGSIKISNIVKRLLTNNATGC